MVIEAEMSVGLYTVQSVDAPFQKEEGCHAKTAFVVDCWWMTRHIYVPQQFRTSASHSEHLH